MITVTNKLIAVITTISIINLYITPTICRCESLSSNNSIFMSYTTGTRFVADYKFYKKSATDLGKKLVNDDQYIKNCDSEVLALKQGSALMKIDMAALDKAKEEYKKNYEDTNKALIDCQNSTPSRYTWFSLGALSAAVVFVIGIVMIKR